MIRRLVLLAACALSLAACAKILGFREPGPHPFEHRAHVVAGVSCLKCHKVIESAGEEGALHIPTTADCVSCHEKPHDPSECSTCHGMPFSRSDASQAKRFLRFSHASHDPRVRGNCVRCHPDAAHDGSELRPPMATCFGCHAHEDQFKTRDCGSCHVDLPAELVRPQSHVVHDGDFVREHGTRAASAMDLCETCHKQRFCASCHGRTVSVLPERLHFNDVMRAGVHRAGFRSRHAEEARNQPGLCSTCHTQPSCQSCHDGLGVSAAASNPRTPHPPGWLGVRGQPNEHGRAAWRNPGECASCHGGAGEALCVGCHRVGGSGGNPHPAGWSSPRSKRELPCSLCHPGGI